ncbi:MAG TPA: FlgD immunoglobulin-like domain containing protein [Candidatus Kapabacteria bacterium]|nr:FlgD immunoglobulin-like domain containing protein [Candidatus Kapabacteria bacterium]
MLKITILIILFSFSLAKAQRDSSANTIMIKEKEQSALEILKNSLKDSTNNSNKLPTENNFTKEQDSAFNRAYNSHLPFFTLLNSGIEYSNDLWLLHKELEKGTPWQIALDNIRNIPREFYIPSGVEMVHHEIAIQNSQFIPFVKTIPQYGKFNIQEILNFFGLVEDISPAISYSIDFVAEVEVVIYSVSSTVVATLFHGRQVPSKYTITWNGRDSQGKIMPEGDYIGEVRIGNDKFIRKRIRLR